MALTGPRATPRRSSYIFEAEAPVGAGAVLWQGAMAVYNAAGFLVPATTALGLKTPCQHDTDNGRRSVDNTGGANGDKTARVFFGVFLYKNHGADLVVAADRGAQCFIIDDETVAKTNGTNTRSVAGTVVDVTAEGVWVSQPRT